MARIPEEEIERLKSQISLERLAEAKGVKLKKHGENLLGLCPFHDDREPSLVITPAKNLWHCLGACQAGGTVIDWVMRAEGVRFRHAVELLKADIPSLDAEPTHGGRRTRPTVKTSTVPKLPVLTERSVSDDVLLQEVVGYYHETLKQSPEALAYLEKRGLKHPELVERFRLGFANRTLAYRLPQKNRRTGAELRGQLQRIGVLRESGHEHLNGSLVIPIFGEQGEVTELYGRKVNDHLREGTPLHLYLPGPHRGVWNMEALASSKEIILCESLIDALTFWCAGFRNVTASYGVEGFTDDHREAFRRHGIERVLIAYDRDDAGDRAAEKLAPELAEMGIEVFRVLFPKGMDANEYALKVGPAEKSLGLVLRQAVWLAGTRGANSIASEPQAEIAIDVATASDAPEALPAFEAAVPAEAVIDDINANASVLEMLGEPLEVEPIPSLAAESDAARERVPAAPASAPSDATAVETKGDEAVLVFGDRRWRVRGLPPKPLPGSLRVNLLISRENGFHVDTLELYSARQRAHFVKLASEELGIEERVVKRDLGEVLLRLEELIDKRQRQAEEAAKKAELSEGDRDAALALLRDPKLLERIIEDFERCGVVGEHTNKLVGYLAATSRKLDEPLAIVIQSSSAAGKSSLMDAVLSLMPEEERVQYSAMTGQSLFYMGESNLQHKILAIVEEEGAERASYALKLLQSEGELTIASTGKDPATGRLVTQEYRVEGPVMIFLTTTAIEVDEELLNRCIVLSVDEGREQTRAIHRRQREAQTLEGLLAKEERRHVVRLHQNAQRLLRPLCVANPFARELTFLDHQTRTRRDHMKYLTLIRAVALLHQYQRPVKTAEHRGRSIRYIEVTRHDIAVANRLAHEVLGRSLDELPPQTRRLLGLIDAMVASECGRLDVDRSDFRFSRRQVREWTGWGDTQLRVHLGRLIEMEYVLAHRGRQGQSYAYELCFLGANKAGPFLAGLVEVEQLRASVTPTSRGSEPNLAGGVRGECGPDAGGVRADAGGAIQHQSGSKSDFAADREARAHRGNGQKPGTLANAAYARAVS